MQADEAVDYAERLTVLKYFPSGSSGLLQVSKLIAEICVTAQEAEWLVCQVRKRFDEWPGPATLRAMRHEHFGQPEPFKPISKSNFQRDCDQCSDLGFFRNRYGIYMRCECESGSLATDERLADLNRRLKPRGFTRISDIKAGPIQ